MIKLEAFIVFQGTLMLQKIFCQRCTIKLSSRNPSMHPNPFFSKISCPVTPSSLKLVVLKVPYATRSNREGGGAWHRPKGGHPVLLSMSTPWGSHKSLKLLLVEAGLKSGISSGEGLVVDTGYTCGNGSE